MKLHQPEEQIFDKELALQMLKEGNQRFVTGQLCDKSSYSLDRELLQQSQNPFAVVITCSDSRVAPEIFFDQKIGDLFVIRNAGNVVEDVVLASIEYGVKYLNCPLVVVCGHSNCGAISAVCEGNCSLPHVQSLVEKISPALENPKDIEGTAKNHVKNVVAQIKDDVKEMAVNATVVGAFYDLSTGEVLWLDEL